MEKFRPYIKAIDLVLIKPKKDVPIYWRNNPIKAIRMCRIVTRKPKCTVTFMDDSVTIIDANERLYFDVR